MIKVIDHPEVVRNRRYISTTISTEEYIQDGEKIEQTASFNTEFIFYDFKVGCQDDNLSQLDCISRYLKKHFHLQVIIGLLIFKF